MPLAVFAPAADPPAMTVLHDDHLPDGHLRHVMGSWASSDTCPRPTVADPAQLTAFLAEHGYDADPGWSYAPRRDLWHTAVSTSLSDEFDNKGCKRVHGPSTPTPSPRPRSRAHTCGCGQGEPT